MNFMNRTKIGWNRIEKSRVFHLIPGTITGAGNHLRDAGARQNGVYEIDQNPNEVANVNTIAGMVTKEVSRSSV